MQYADHRNPSHDCQSSSGCVRRNIDRPLRRLLCAVPLATMAATTGETGSALAQTAAPCTSALCLQQTQDQENLLSLFNNLGSSSAGQALLSANLLTEENIYINATQAQKIASGTVFIIQDVPANILLRAFPKNPAFGYIAGLPTAPDLPATVQAAVTAIYNNNQIVGMKAYFDAYVDVSVSYHI